MSATFGTFITTSSGSVVGESGAPIRVVSVQITSGGTASVVTLKNGTSSSGTVYYQGTGTINQTTTPANFPAGGLYFPGGCFISWDGNGSGANVQFEQATTI